MITIELITFIGGLTMGITIGMMIEHLYNERRKIQFGYPCRLKITERDVLSDFLKFEIKRLTKLSKEFTSFSSKNRIKNRKRFLARIFSKMEHLEEI